MAFRRTTQHTREEILSLAEAEAEKAGVGEYLIIVKRGRVLVTVADESEIRSGDSFVGIVTDAKGGVE